MFDPVHEHNRRAWDEQVRRDGRFTRPAEDENYQEPLNYLDSRGWLGGDVRGKRILCLAAGGGKHGPLFAAAGAITTVVDLSAEMLVLDREVAQERGLNLQTVQASMDDLRGLPAAGFEIVVQPVSTCYVPDVTKVYREVARVIVLGGLYLSQHKQPTSLQTSVRPAPSGQYELVEPYYREGSLPAVKGSLHREEGTLEFLHRWEELLGGLCRAGFVIEDMSEPLHADPQAHPETFKHRSYYAPPYVRIKARRVMREGDSPPSKGSGLWLP